MSLRDDRWTAASSWGRGRSHRETFLFGSGDDVLYASLYGSPRSERALGVVVCPSWGAEGRHLLTLGHRLALGVAKRGGTGLVFHWPGFEDSEGESGDATLDLLTQACLDAAAAGRARTPVTRWAVVGIGLGASVATLAAPQLAARSLLLVQPSLDPSRYVDDLERTGKRAALRLGAPDGWAFGHPVPVGLRTADAAARVRDALAAFDGRAAVVAYAEPAPGVPAGLAMHTVPGDWRRPRLRDHRPLVAAAAKWLRAEVRRR
jgi:hypothetical protein